MTNPVCLKSVDERSVLEGPAPSPTKGKSRGGSRGSSSRAPRHSELPLDSLEKKVRFGSSVYYGAPNKNVNKSRSSPSRDKCPRSSPSKGEFYAGFSDSPSPTTLPKPPSHWVTTIRMSSGRPSSDASFRPTVLPNIKMVLSTHA